MTEQAQKLLPNLVLLSNTDSSLASIAAEKKKLDAELKARRTALDQKLLDAQSKRSALDDRKRRHAKDEKVLNEERAKLVDRRKALATFNQPKIQQAADREIGAAADALNAQEEGLIGMLAELEASETETKTAEAAAAKLQSEFDAYTKELQATLINLEDRQRDHEARRAEIVKAVPPGPLSIYTKVRERHAQKVVAAVSKNSCTGCFMSLVPQVLVQVARAENIVKCPGCGRILCLEEHLKVAQ
jgi:predicted  nucleic acid-binding Zn-ribbon protein